MNEKRLSQKSLEGCPPKRRRKRKGKPQNSRMQEVMREKGIDNMELIDREEWRRKIKL